MVRKFLLFLLFSICPIMDMSSRDEIGLILYESYIQSLRENEERPPELKVAFQIHVAIAKQAIRPGP
jgi:hypothetical protein